jgi:hypothetical protein
MHVTRNCDIYHNWFFGDAGARQEMRPQIGSILMFEPIWADYGKLPRSFSMPGQLVKSDRMLDTWQKLRGAAGRNPGDCARLENGMLIFVDVYLGVPHGRGAQCL